MQSFLVLAILLSPLWSWAQETKPVTVLPSEPQRSQTCPSAAEWRSASLAQLNVDQWICEDVALFHAHRGARLIAAGLLEEAAVALEKALLLEPNLPGTQLDYAQALAQIGLKGSARAILADVLQRPDIQPALKEKLEKGQVSGLNSNGTSVAMSSTNLWHPDWQWAAMAQTAFGHETNLNSASSAESLTLMLSNGPVTLGLADSTKPVPGPAFKSVLAVQASSKSGLGLINWGELSFNAALSQKRGTQSNELANSTGVDNQTLEGVMRYSMPMEMAQLSGQLQMALSGTQFWVTSARAYSDTGAHLKFNWDTFNLPCKVAPSIGQNKQQFPLSTTLNGAFTYTRLDLLCKKPQEESLLSMVSGTDQADASNRPGGDKQKTELLFRHERLVSFPAQFLGNGQFSAWTRVSHTKDKSIYSELLGDIKTSTKRLDGGLGYWASVNRSWSVGLNLEVTSQKSNNPLFNLKNSAVYAGLRWTNN